MSTSMSRKRGVGCAQIGGCMHGLPPTHDYQCRCVWICADDDEDSGSGILDDHRILYL